MQQERTATAVPTTAADPALIEALEEVQRRVLWLATLMIHHANHERPNLDGSKIGGHQASSASLVTLLTVVMLHWLRHGDRMAVKPHASPVYHALNYLMGRLDGSYLTQLRSFGGLQAYPSRTKDPDPADFSTGSVGLGAVAPVFAALTADYLHAHFGTARDQRFVAFVGDAELDEGNVWEAIIDPATAGVSRTLLIVDLNRQSLDRVVPGIRSQHLQRLFAGSGWRVLEAKYGRKLQQQFARPDGERLRRRIDQMSNEEYQALIRLNGADLRPRLVGDDSRLGDLLSSVGDRELPELLANLGGHDIAELLDCLAAFDAEPQQPTILFAYTIKGYGLPIAGHPLNHSMLLSPQQIDQLQQQFGIDPARRWDALASDSAGGRLCAEAARRLARATVRPSYQPQLPAVIDVPVDGQISTQETFGRALARLADEPQLAARIVTTSPDVSVSTNLGGWINKCGVFALHDETDYETEAYRLLRWRRGPHGRHIELGISEMNLFMALTALGLSEPMLGEALIPIGTVYDPFICRGLDALIYGLYSDARFIVIGTPSGITLAPEGGAHQSSVTVSLGMELPNLAQYEPAFARETVWLFHEALRRCHHGRDGISSYLRMSTRPIDQALLEPALRRLGEDELRRQVLRGGYRLIDRRDSPDRHAPLLQLVASGAVMPEAVAAAHYLQREGVAVNLINLTSPRAVYEAWRSGDSLDWLIAPDERSAPILSVHDAASHALAWLGSVHGAPQQAVGIDRFGQSGARDDLYRAFALDPLQIAEAGFQLVDRFMVTA